jgi:hypothetical protein
LILAGEQSGLLMRTVTTGSGSSSGPTKKLAAFVELEREVLTVTFYLESTRADSCR